LEEAVEYWTSVVMAAVEELRLKVVVARDEKKMAVVEEEQHAPEAKMEELELLQSLVAAAVVALMECLAREGVVERVLDLEAAVVLH
jgi:hypothetical protein